MKVFNQPAPGIAAIVRASTASMFLLTASCAMIGGVQRNASHTKDDSGESAVCPQSHSGTTRDLPEGATVTICDKFYDSAPFVRLPESDDFADESHVTFYGAVDMLYPAKATLQDRTGQKYLVLNANGALNGVYDYSALPASMGMPSFTYVYLIYKFEGKLAPVPDDTDYPGTKGIILSTATPMIYVPSTLIDDYVLGSWEGKINLRIDPAPAADDIGADLFDTTSQATIRITYKSLQPIPSEFGGANALHAWPDLEHGHQYLLDVKLMDAVGAVDNFNGNVMGSDGTCIKALSLLGNRNPFLDATSGDIQFFRWPGMHGAGSEADVMVFPDGARSLYHTGMSLPFSMKASTLILPNPQYVVDEFPHGIHRGFELSGLRKVSGGGGACE
jgi:hypothetical protein